MAFPSSQRASIPHIASSSSSSPSSCFSHSSSIHERECQYDVFMSFRGEDTRKNFVDHLHTALNQKGIYTFKDDENLKRGKEISPELLKAIQGSRVSIVIFSKNYASSRWCLDELVKITDCMKANGQTVFPVFYEVDPSDVRKQTGCFAEAFAQHELDSVEKVHVWRAALKEVVNVSGWDSRDRFESKFIQEIVEEVFNKLSGKSKRPIKNLVGMHSRVKQIKMLLDKGSEKVLMIGICGMGGIGKTTVARAVYWAISDGFEERCYVANARERGLVPLQKELLSMTLMAKNMNISDVEEGIIMIRDRLCNKRVLVILDDVDQLDQLESLAGKHDWFGPGSRIIITTRDEHLLLTHGVDKIYKVKEMNHDEALQLFSQNAFKTTHPPKDFGVLSDYIVHLVQGLPLALKVLGSFLFGRSIIEWKSALDRLKEIPNRNLFDTLKISYDGLEEFEKEMFLDIACFFKGKEKDYVTRILDSCGFCTNIGISVLVQKCLVTISHGRLWMHDLIQEMGQYIVRQESPKEPGKRSRLWLQKDVFQVLTKNTGTEAVEGLIFIKGEHLGEDSLLKGACLSAEAFAKMHKLRLLIIHNVSLPQGLKNFPNELRFLEWHGYPSKSMPSNFEPRNLVELDMPYSNFEQLWKGVKDLKKMKFINLSQCQNLIKTPDFTGFPNVERLILEGCTRLSEIHPSIGVLTSLILLNLRDCKNLAHLPDSICQLKVLESLYLSGCSKLEKLPENLGNAESLVELHADETSIKQVPSSIAHLKKLKVLSFSKCLNAPTKPWWSAPFLPWLLPGKSQTAIGLQLPSLKASHSLVKLNLSYCNVMEGGIPSDIGHLPSLEELNLSGNSFVTLPESISQLPRLTNLQLVHCQRLQSLPQLPSSIEEVDAHDCLSLERLSKPLAMTKSWGFNFSNCLKLVGNQYNYNAAAIILQTLLQVPDPLAIRFKWRIVLPGSEIPAWFHYQNMELSNSIQLLPRWYNKKFIVCCLCVVLEAGAIITKMPNIICSFELHGCSSCRHETSFFPHSTIEDCNVDSCHVWMCFEQITAHCCCEDTELMKGFSKFEFSFSFGADEKYRVSFPPHCTNFVGKKFGVHLLCDEDVTEIREKLMNEYNFFFKRRRGDNQFYEEAEPSRNECSDEDSHPKRNRTH